MVLGAILLSHSVTAYGEVLKENTVWEDQVLVEDDVLVPAGVTLTIRQGTRVRVQPADGTRTDPQYMSPMTEITVRGRLVVEGSAQNRVVFQLEPGPEPDNSWAGIIVDGGNVDIASAVIRDAQTGVWIIGGSLDMRNAFLTSNRYGLVAQRKATRVKLKDTRIKGNEYGLVAFNNAAIEKTGTAIENNRKKDVYSNAVAAPVLTGNTYAVNSKNPPIDLVDKVLLGDTIWQGHIRVTGQVRVPVEARLIIMPGTLVEFMKKDTNGDGIGESGLMLQGVLIAKGTAKQPILFRSGEPEKKKGAWDAVNIINSDGVRNIIEYCQFENADRGLHFHFSNVFVQRSIFLNNYRGVQFQESTVELRENSFFKNVSAIQARDSKISFTDNYLADNVFGANFLRSHLTIRGNRFENHLDVGLRVREGFPAITDNMFLHNRFGLMFNDTSYGSVADNLILENSETGMSVRTGANVEISGNCIQANGLSGISVRDTAAVIRGNHISENGERGIGLASFQGSITRNTFVGNRLYALALEDEGDVVASSNWFDRTDIEPIIFDHKDDAGRGEIQYRPILEKPPLFTWSWAGLPSDVHWSGGILVAKTVSVPTETTLFVKPGTNVFFAPDTGLDVRGRLLALGRKDQRIRFTAAEEKAPGSWGEIRIEYSTGSRFSNCDFEYANWGIHSHFNTLSVIGCSFKNSNGGIRFRSGPLEIKNSLFSDNSIGIRSFRGNAEIISNVISGNDKGIFVREKGGGLTITGNNIFRNRNYNIWVGDFNREDINATGNWWGVDDPTRTFFDGRIEPGIGTVLFEPVLGEPLDISILDPEYQ